jgi:predicted nucleic acid-binding protein
MSFYLDANVLVSLFAVDAHTNKVDAWIDSDPGALFVSNFARVEFAAVVSRQVRVKAISDTAAREALADFDDWAREMTQPIEAEMRDMILAESLVRDFATKLAAADALHLALASNRGYRLATFDTRLASAAAMRGVRVAELG